MKKALIFLLSLSPALTALAQPSALEVRKYILPNGFTILLNEDPNAQSVYGAVVVKAGGKNDPATATGLAHYLEHLLFKGTTELGTTNYEKEKPFLDSINYYYDRLGMTKDEEERKKIQDLINNQSVQAAKYALPTEFDKLVKSIGGTRLNAFTTVDMTVYHNSFPAEQMEKWLELYSHRFQKPVFRSFQSELEVVYEEKNRSMDNFQTKIFEEFSKQMFRHHPYGTQTTIGTVDHLKNPSLNKIYEFYNTWYVANNMALVLSGNFDSGKVFPLIKEKFGKLRTGAVPAAVKYPPTIFTKKEVVKVRYTPIRASVIGYKTIPAVHEDKAALEVISNLLNNEAETGKLDKLKLDGKLLEAGNFNMNYNEDGNFALLIVPKLIGQSIKKAESAVLAEIENIKKGNFSDTDLQVIRTEMYRQTQQRMENNYWRAFAIVQSFSEGSDWQEHLNYIKRIDKVSREDVMRVASKYFGENYFAMQSHMGFPKKHKLKKPGYKPVLNEQKEESAYAKKFNSEKGADPIPKFLAMEDSWFSKLNESNGLYVTSNPINDVFSLKVVFHVGSDSLKNLDLASHAFSYLHTKNQTTSQLRQELALAGLTYYITADDDAFTIEFTGLDKNLEKSISLVNKIVHETEVDEKGIDIMRQEVKASRKSSEKQPSTLGDALYNYALYSGKSDYLDRLSKKDLKKLEAEDLLKLYRQAILYNATWHYTGTTSAEKIQTLISTHVKLADNRKEVPFDTKPFNKPEKNQVYLLHDKKSVQSQVYFYVPSANYAYDPFLSAGIRAFNEYMGGSFSGLIMQEIREYRSLAYSAGGSLVKPMPHKPLYFYAYIGCQSDKTNEAVDVMYRLLDSMPQKPERMDAIRSLMKNNVSAYYPNFRYISLSIDNTKRQGYNFMPLKKDYAVYNSIEFSNVLRIYEDYVRNRPMIITISGNKSNMNLAGFEKYGKIIEVKKSDIIKD